MMPSTNVQQEKPGKSSDIVSKRVMCKVSIVGDGAVGKTSLIGRFVYNIFDDDYLVTIGTKVSRKELLLDYPEKNMKIEVDMMLWDIMGQKTFRTLLHEAYFLGARGIIAVCDLTRRETLDSLPDWIQSVHGVVGTVPVIILGNKMDLAGEVQYGISEVEEIAKNYDAKFFVTSAKTGQDVEQSFDFIARDIIKNQGIVS